MKLGCVLLFASAAACGGGNSGGMDAAPGADAGIDAGVDAVVDGALTPDADPLADTDGDGVLDTVDLCPTVADPAQVDLDGDHIGWMCDNVESTTIAYTGTIGYSQLAARGNTIGGALSYEWVSGAWAYHAFSVGPAGVSRAEGEMDTWLRGRPSRAFVGAENQVVWSMLDGVVGTLDAGTDTFTTHHTDTLLWGPAEDIVTRYERGDLLVLSGQAQDSLTQSFKLLAPQAGGDVVAIATSSQAFVSPTIVGTNPARLVFGVADTAQRSLREFVAGSGTSQPIEVGGTPLANADAVLALSRAYNEMFGFCVDQGGKRYIVETSHAELRAYELPVSTCSVQVQLADDPQATLLTHTEGAFLVRNGVVQALALEGALEALGAGLPAVVTKWTPPTYEVYVVDAAGTVHAVTSDGVSSKVSRQGDTLHFISFHQGSHSVVRFRNGVITQAALPAIPQNQGEVWEVFTTKEGAALVSTNVRAAVWPSQASVATPVDFDHINALVRGDATLFVASHNDVRSQPALYSYAEVGGVPQYTPLTPEVLQNVAFTMSVAPLGYSVPGDSSGGPETNWFIFGKSGECRLAWPKVTGTTVTLMDERPCGGGAVIRGVTPTGATVVGMGGSASFPELYLLDGTTFTKVVVANTIQLLYAAPGSSLVLGWEGRDVAGDRYICSAAHPTQCWTPPANEARAWGPGATADVLHALFDHNTTTAKVFTSIRTFGQGNRPQPLL
ncbi:MAG: thrombospondin type 3 repeat-containing protein [Kofleriaceae bacterium]|nr:thrombospondin type 3 repeat-containing protein [Kofleriaceae bacterium]